MADLPALERDEPEARIEPAGTSFLLHRPQWRVYVSHGITCWGPDGLGWIVTGGRAKAERKARRVLAAYLREHHDGRQSSAITLADLEAPRD